MYVIFASPPRSLQGRIFNSDYVAKDDLEF